MVPSIDRVGHAGRIGDARTKLIRRDGRRIDHSIRTGPSVPERVGGVVTAPAPVMGRMAAGSHWGGIRLPDTSPRYTRSASSLVPDRPSAGTHWDSTLAQGIRHTQGGSCRIAAGVAADSEGTRDCHREWEGRKEVVAESTARRWGWAAASILVAESMGRRRKKRAFGCSSAKGRLGRHVAAGAAAAAGSDGWR